MRSAGDEGTDILALQDAHQRAGIAHVVDAQRNVVFTAECEGGGIHHLQVAVQHLVVSQALEALGIRIFFGSES